MGGIARKWSPLSIKPSRTASRPYGIGVALLQKRPRPSRGDKKMYAIGFLYCGFQFILAGQVTAQEMQAWMNDVQRHLLSSPKDFGLLLDLRTLAPLSPAATTTLATGIQLCQQRGLRRTAVIVLKRATKLELARLAKESGIDQWERYLSADDTPDWRERGLAWIDQGIDTERR